MPIDLPTAADIVTIGNWLWNSYGKPAMGKVTKDVADRLEAHTLRKQWEQATTDYLERVQDQIKFVGILGKIGGHKALDQIYTDVYLLDEVSANRRYGLAGLEAEFVSRQAQRQEDSKRQKGEAVVAREQRLFILGKPGAGKTTFLKQVAWQALKQNRQNDHAKKLPIFITLKELSDSGLPLVPFIEAQFERAGFPNAAAFANQLLRFGDVIVLLDGLDEVNQEEGQRSDMITAITQFVFEFHRCQILLTCRVAASNYDFQGFTYVEMADFTPEQQKTFIYRWFDKRHDKEACWQALQDSHNKTLQELARIPLLLSLLCVVFKTRPNKDFPKERHKIYQEATQALLEGWDEQDKRVPRRDTTYEALSRAHKKALLAEIAAQTFAEEEYFIPQQRLAGLIEAYLLREQISEQPDGVFVLREMEAHHGLLIERAKNIYSFSHLTLQEYFTAHYIVANEVRGSLPRLMAHVGDDRWREVFLLTAAMLNDATDFAELYLDALAGLMDQDETLTTMLHWIASRSTNLPSGVKPPAARAFNLFLIFALTLDFSPNIEHFPSQDIAISYELLCNFDPEFRHISDQFLGDIEFRRMGDFNYFSFRVFSYVLLLGLAVVYYGSTIMESLPSDPAKIIAQLQAWGAKFDLPFQKSIGTLSVPDGDIFSDQWQLMRVSLEKILLDYLGVDQFWEWSEEQANLLTRYLQANRLLLECLDVAYVPDRQAIVDQLLLPPG
jgi:hypothetical protein